MSYFATAGHENGVPTAICAVPSAALFPNSVGCLHRGLAFALVLTGASRVAQLKFGVCAVTKQSMVFPMKV